MKKKLLFLLNSLNIGGAERQTVQLVKLLDRSRFDITVCYLLPSRALKNAIDDRKDLQLKCLNKKHPIDLMVLIRLLGLVLKTRPETIVCINLLPALYLGAIRLFLDQFKAIAIQHTTVAPTPREKFIANHIYAPIVNRATQLIFVCSRQMEYWISTYGINRDKATFIYNGVDTNHFKPSGDLQEANRIRAELDMDGETTVVSICATMSPLKRHIDLVDAGKLLLLKGTKIKILMIGDGQERAKIEKHVESSQMSRDVFITGMVDDVRPYLGVSDICVLCSSTETFPMSILEAMAMGKAVIGPKMGGLPELIAEGLNGMLYPSGDVAALAQAIETIIENRSAKQMGVRSREIAVAKFNIELMAERYNEIFWCQ
jgi:glycosyltransferase involved in cell wall biosynthesis